MLLGSTSCEGRGDDSDCTTSFPAIHYYSSSYDQRRRCGSQFTSNAVAKACCIPTHRVGSMDYFSLIGMPLWKLSILVLLLMTMAVAIASATYSIIAKNATSLGLKSSSELDRTSWLVWGGVIFNNAGFIANMYLVAPLAFGALYVKCSSGLNRAKMYIQWSPYIWCTHTGSGADTFRLCFTLADTRAGNSRIVKSTVKAYLTTIGPLSTTSVKGGVAATRHLSPVTVTELPVMSIQQEGSQDTDDASTNVELFPSGSPILVPNIKGESNATTFAIDVEGTSNLLFQPNGTTEWELLVVYTGQDSVSCKYVTSKKFYTRNDVIRHTDTSFP